MCDLACITVLVAAMLLETLPLDLIDLILSSLPDLRSLVAFAQVCKRVHHVYQARLRSLRTAVAKNEVGDAFLQAVRLARFQREYDGEVLDKLCRFDEFYLIAPEETRLDTTVVDWKEAAILSKNARILKEFELFYSRRCANTMSLSLVTISKQNEDIRTVGRPVQLYPVMSHCV
jgi:hypothetical protein